jgi:hypothetical protein
VRTFFDKTILLAGCISTGRDIAAAQMMGADLAYMGTRFIATQDPDLRKKFEGKPEHVVNYFFFVAEEVRELMAQLGIRKFDELIGRTELLDTKKGIEHWKACGLDFSRIFYMPKMPPEVARFHCEPQNHGLEKALDNRLIELAQPALERGEKVTIETISTALAMTTQDVEHTLQALRMQVYHKSDHKIVIPTKLIDQREKQKHKVRRVIDPLRIQWKPPVFTASSRTWGW